MGRFAVAQPSLPAPAFGSTLSGYLGSDLLPGSSVRSPGHHLLAVDHVRTAAGKVCESRTLPAEAAFHIVLQLRDMPSHELWLDGRPIRTAPYPRHSISIIDLSRGSRTRIASAHEALVFYLDRRALGELAEEFGTSRVDTLRLPPGVPSLDPVMARLGAGLLPHLAEAVGNRLLVDHLLLLMQAHVAVAYGVGRAPPKVLTGGLAPWQERRAKEMMETSLARVPSLSELAREVSLSTSHFTRSFKRSTGLSPHTWLARRRVEAAKTMLLGGALSIGSIAAALGYAEQASFTKAFRRHVGLSPSAWARRERC